MNTQQVGLPLLLPYAHPRAVLLSLASAPPSSLGSIIPPERERLLQRAHYVHSAQAGSPLRLSILPFTKTEVGVLSCVLSLKTPATLLFRTKSFHYFKGKKKGGGNGFFLSPKAPSMHEAMNILGLQKCNSLQSQELFCFTEFSTYCTKCIWRIGQVHVFL